MNHYHKHLDSHETYQPIPPLSFGFPLQKYVTGMGYEMQAQHTVFQK